MSETCGILRRSSDLESATSGGEKKGVWLVAFSSSSSFSSFLLVVVVDRKASF